MASRRFFTILLAIAGAATFYLLIPLGPALLFGAVLAAATSPLYEKLNAKLRDHRQISAVLFCLAFVLIVLIPVSLAVLSALGDIVDAAQRASDIGVDGLLEKIPPPLRDRVHEVGVDAAWLQEKLASVGGRIVTTTGTVLKATGDTIFSIVVLLIAFVVFLVEGKRIIRWLSDVVPLERAQTEELFREFRKMSTSVIVGNFGTSAVQAMVALVGYLIAGVPSPLVVTLFTFIFSFVPAIGGAGTCLLAAGGLALAGETWRAVFLAAWAVAVVGVVDNIIKPILVKRGVRLHGALIFFAIIAGIAAFGASGLLLGPLIVTFGLTLVRIYQRDFRAAA